MPANSATLAVLKTKEFWNDHYDVIISVHDVTSKILSYDSIVVMAILGMALNFYASAAKDLKIKFRKFWV